MTAARRPAPEARHGGVVRPLRPEPEPILPVKPEPAVLVEWAEECVLGVVMLAGRLLPEVTRHITSAEDFYRPAHRTIWTTLQAMATAGTPLDEALVVAELARRGKLDDLGGPLFIHHLVEQPATVSHAEHYAVQVAEAAALRRRADLGHKLAALEPTADPSVVAAYAAELAELAAGQPRGWEPPVPLGATSRLPAFPVEVLPTWLGEYVAAVATATQTPPDLGGMLSLTALAAVAAGAVEIEPRPDWREPLCLYVAVGMEPGSRKSAVVNALTGPLVTFEQEQAETAKAIITEAATLRRVAEQAAHRAEQAAGRATDPAEVEKLRAEAIARAAEAANLTVPPPPRWLADDATPEALASLLAAHGRIALLSAEGDVFDDMAGRYQQAGSGAGPNLRVYLKGHAGDWSRVDRRGRDPEYIPRACLTIGVSPQPDVLRGLADKPGFRGRGLLARFLYSLPVSLLGRRQTGRTVPPVPAHVADRYAAELRILAGSLATPASLADGEPAILGLEEDAAAILDGFEAHLEPRLAPGSGDLAGLGGWASKLTGATCRIAGLLHLAAHVRTGWARPVAPDTLGGAVRLAGYLIEHALAVFDLMGTDQRTEDARWLLSWIERTGRQQFTRREAHMAAPRGRFRKATDLDPALSLLEEHGYVRRTDPTPPGAKGGRPASPRYLVNPLHQPTEPTKPTQPRTAAGSVDDAPKGLP